ncbi:hypothetical protein BCR39DRAFT_586664 [Naematelia encephala]|uniref:Cysteine-rich transmembrane CYSTM domain-containing protein n=1 Tax=Naematelia encephala TaxID=71784 RepID=A0A1Y2BEB3_9TREE|nr:hypothetical protein BCR39DRAFT_586664 [Naematelia encephala]
MNKPSYPQQNQGGQQMYQASDGKWYPVAQMPQNWNQNQSHLPQQQNYYGQQPMNYGQQQGYQQPGQPIYVQQQQRPYGGGAETSCLAALCGALLCFDLGACLF